MRVRRSSALRFDAQVPPVAREIGVGQVPGSRTRRNPAARPGAGRRPAVLAYRGLVEAVLFGDEGAFGGARRLPASAARVKPWLAWRLP